MNKETHERMSLFGADGFTGFDPMSTMAGERDSRQEGMVQKQMP